METSTDTFSAVAPEPATADPSAAAPSTAAVAPHSPVSRTVGALSVEPAGPDRPRNPMRALRFPEDGDPAPNLGRMVGMSVWAAALALLGMVVAVRTFIAIMLGPGPDWLVPTVMSVGIGGTVSAGLAFATVHHKWLPWELLGVASLLLSANLLLVITQL